MSKINILIFTILFLSTAVSYSGSATSNISENDTDRVSNFQYAFFDLRERETFIQLTNTSPGSQVVHVQIFNVDNNCNENDFF